MKSKSGTILNLNKISKYMQARGWLGLVWGKMSYDAKNSSKSRMSILLLRGEPKEYQFGVDWYQKTDAGYENAEGDCVSFQFVRLTPDVGLFWAPELVSRYYGHFRETLGNYLPQYDLSLSRIRVLPSRLPDDRGLSPVLPRDVSRVGHLPLHHKIDGLCFNSEGEFNAYLMENVRFFTRVRGLARLNNGTRRINHWKIGPIRA